MQLWRLSHLFGFLVACGLLFSVAHADNAKANTTTLGAGWDKAVAKSMVRFHIVYMFFEGRYIFIEYWKAPSLFWLFLCFCWRLFALGFKASGDGP
jgi:hypothetical protein